MTASWLLLIVALALVPWWLGPAPAGLWSAASLTASLWPVLLAVPLVLGRVWLGRWAGVAVIPAGDILVPVAGALGRVLRGARWCGTIGLPVVRAMVLAGIGRAARALDPTRVARRVEARLGAWPNALVVLLLLGVMAALLGGFQP